MMTPRNALRSAFALAALGGLAACAAPAPRPGPELVALTPTEQFSIQVSNGLDEIQLAPSGALSPNQQAAVAALAQRWRETGEGPIVVHAAAAGPASGTAQAAAGALNGLGVPSAFVQIASFDAPAGAPPLPVRVGFTRLVASGPQCANLWTSVTKTGGNEPMSTFGCSTTANLAAQIADPRDLVAPRAEQPADAARRATVLEKYRKGEPTGSTRGEDERGDVSGVKK